MDNREVRTDRCPKCLTSCTIYMYLHKNGSARYHECQYGSQWRYM